MVLLEARRLWRGAEPGQRESGVNWFPQQERGWVEGLAEALPFCKGAEEVAPEAGVSACPLPRTGGSSAQT